MRETPNTPKHSRLQALRATGCLWFLLRPSKSSHSVLCRTTIRPPWNPQVAPASAGRTRKKQEARHLCCQQGFFSQEPLLASAQPSAQLRRPIPCHPTARAGAPGHSTPQPSGHLWSESAEALAPGQGCRWARRKEDKIRDQTHTAKGL